MPNTAISETPLAEQTLAHIDAGDLDSALSCFEQAMAAGAGPVDVAARVAEAAMTAKRFDVAERYYAEVVRVVPDNAIIRLNHSYALHRLNRYIEGRDEVALACELAPDMTNAQTFLGRVNHSLNRYDEAVAAFERVILREPRNARAWLNFGEALIGSYSRFEEGAAALAKAAMLGAEDQDLLIAVANGQLGNGYYAEAEEDRIDALRDLDVCFASVNKFDEVESRFLAPIDRRLDLVVSGNPNDMQQRWPAYHDYLRRPDDDMLMLTEYATIALPPPLGVGNALVDAFDSKLLYFHTGGPLPISPLSPLSFLGASPTKPGSAITTPRSR